MALNNGDSSFSVECNVESNVCESDCAQISGREEPVTVPPMASSVDLDAFVLKPATSNPDPGDDTHDSLPPVKCSSSSNSFPHSPVEPMSPSSIPVGQPLSCNDALFSEVGLLGEVMRILQGFGETEECAKTEDTVPNQQGPLNQTHNVGAVNSNDSIEPEAEFQLEEESLPLSSPVNAVRATTDDTMASYAENQQPIPMPEQTLMESFHLLSSDSRMKKVKGLDIIRQLAQFHAEVLSTRLQHLCTVVTEVMNQRLGVPSEAMKTLGHLFTHMKKEMDPVLDYTVRELLNKSGDDNKFIQQDVDAALASMVQNCSPMRAMKALISGGLNHWHTAVRKCTAQHLASLVKMTGANLLLSGKRHLTDRILSAIARLALDSSQETRQFGHQMLFILESHKDFDKLLECHLPANDVIAVRKAVLYIRRKKKLQGESLESGQANCFLDNTAYVRKLNAMMTSKYFPDRITALKQLLADCEQNPDIVIANIFPVFDAIAARLQESNRKVNLCALQCLPKIIGYLKRHMAKGIFILIPAILNMNLNSKDMAIYNAALDSTLALMENIDKKQLLQLFCTEAQLLSGRAKVILVEKVTELVNYLYPQKPWLVEQNVLPLLWYLLGTSKNAVSTPGKGGSLPAATTVLCRVLHSHMGATLPKCAILQDPTIYMTLNKLLRSN